MLYKEASNILENVLSKKGSIKNQVFNSKYQNKKQLYALVCETLKYKSVLTEIIAASNLQRHEKILKQHCMAMVLVYDHLIGKGLHGHPDKFHVAILKHKAALVSQLARLKVKAEVSASKDLLHSSINDEVAIPRYIRVNTLKISVTDAVEHFCREGYTHHSNLGLNYKSYISALRNLKPKQFIRDLHVPQLLAFTPGTDLHDHTLYKDGSIIFQDKASCLPAYILNPPEGSHVIDCCAAPGNKTSHLAAVLNNKGRVFAFDKDSRRAATLRTMLLKAGCLCCDVANADFLKTDPHDPKYKKVEYILVDPSCSGSGIISRQKEDVGEDGDTATEERLDRLAKFQLLILTHALKFPNVQRVVYSTCSVHTKENEMVVNKALQSMGNIFQLSTALKNLPNRGQVMKDSNLKSQRCLRLAPETDLTTGFFVACFKRKRDASDSLMKAPESLNEVDNIAEDDHIEDIPSKKHIEIDVINDNVVTCTDLVTPKKRSKKRRNKNTDSAVSKNKKVESNKEGKHLPVLKGGKKTQKKKSKKRGQHKPVTA